MTNDVDKAAFLALQGHLAVKKIAAQDGSDDYILDILESDPLVHQFGAVTGYNVNICQFLTKVGELEEMDYWVEPEPEPVDEMTLAKEDAE